MNDSYIKEIIKFVTNRLLISFVLICLLFYILLSRLFTLQIIDGDKYLYSQSNTIKKTLPVPAPRGTIYDRNGRPLAVNQSAFMIKIDPSIQVDDMNRVMYDLILLLEQNGESYVDELPITTEKPYRFTFTGSRAKDREKTWKEEMEIKDPGLTLSAEETLQKLREKFKIDELMPDEEARKLINLRSMIYMQRYRQYKPITVAYDVGPKTITTLEEENTKYQSVYIDVDSLRYYPAGPYFSHIIGYIGTISDEEYTTMKDQGYTTFDQIGKTGLERSFESQLKGVDGETQVEVNNMGRRVRYVEEGARLPVPGNKVFLTLDENLQKKTFHILETELRDTLIAKLKGVNKKDVPITTSELFISMVKSNNISIQKIMDATGETSSAHVKEVVLSRMAKAAEDSEAAENPSATPVPDPVRDREAYLQMAKETLADSIETGHILPLDMLLILHEQGIITGGEEYVARLKGGQLRTLQAIIDKLEEGEITPQMTNLDPCTGSVVVTDAKTGNILAAVGYPTYDTNELVNNFNNEYYNQIMQDPTYPMNNRPFREPRAPGSTFKIITAITGLEYGVITPASTIYDEREFTKAGRPYTRCWSSVSHGRLNVSQAIEVSCNYFFCEMSYSLGNSKSGTADQSIDALNKYMKLFGLNDRTGVEIGEYADTFEDDMDIISSPSFKKYVQLSRDEDTPQSQYEWYDGDTVKSSIGQANNNYTSATMAKFYATLATGGERYQLHLMDEIQTAQGQTVEKFIPVLEENVTLAPETWNAINKGMLLVAEGAAGTGHEVFKNFPVRVAGKTGTAQELIGIRSDHSSYGGYAPYEDPEIAVYVTIPYGDTKHTLAPAAVVAREVIAEYMGLNNEPEHPAADNSLAE